MESNHRVVIVGGGFGGLHTALSLKRAPVEVTLIDRRNFHLFQPLLYQVATGGLSPGDIASPLRHVLRKYKHMRVLLGEVTDIQPDRCCVFMGSRAVEYDTLVVAAGAGHSYFGHDSWSENAPGLKTIEDAIAMRHRIFNAFESAERENGTAGHAAWLTFVIVGGGPTGVELAGALAELAKDTLRDDFRKIHPEAARIILVEGSDRILPAFTPELSKDATWRLKYLGVEVRTNTLVTSVEPEGVTVKGGEAAEFIPARTVLWAAGVQSAKLGTVLAQRTGCPVDRIGRIMVEPDLSVPRYPEIFVIGDLAHYRHQTGEPLPGVAQVAMQQGRYLARLIKKRLRGQPVLPFRYRDLGMMAVIGRAAAVVQMPYLRFTGFLAWLAWLFIHLIHLVEYENRLLVLIQWGWNYWTFNRGARLITGDEPNSKDRLSKPPPD